MVKTLVATAKKLRSAGRWDIDFHLPPELINEFPSGLCTPIRTAAQVVKTKRDPTRQPERPFRYVDIASVDVVTGAISTPQDLTGEEAPSRARKVIHAFDIIISTCRPTRGAIAVVPEHLHGEICSTGFCAIRCIGDTNPFYLHFALRLPSTAEQFRKWSTGSSYPAILDEDVEKTLIPLPSPEIQDRIATLIRAATARREQVVQRANAEWSQATVEVVRALQDGSTIPVGTATIDEGHPLSTLAEIRERLAGLPPVEEEPNGGDDLEGTLFDQEGEPDV